VVFVETFGGWSILYIVSGVASGRKRKVRARIAGAEEGTLSGARGGTACTGAFYVEAGEALVQSSCAKDQQWGKKGGEKLRTGDGRRKSAFRKCPILLWIIV